MERIHYLDNLRALAMLLGVYLHAAFAYALPAQSIWLATDPRASITIDASIWFLHLFRMSLFFLLSGFFAKLVIERRGVREFLQGRFLRIVVPMILFYPFLLGATIVVIVFAVSYVDQPRGLIGLIAQAARSNQTVERQPLTTMHLWFLYYLAFLTIIAAGLSRFSFRPLSNLFKRPVLMGLMPLALVPAIASAGTPLPAPESFWPSWWPLVFYGMFYWFGWQLWSAPSVLEKLQAYVWYIILGSCGLFVVYYSYMPVLKLDVVLQQAAELSVARRLMLCLLTAYLSVSLTMAALLLGQRYLQSRSGWLSFLADASYWIYLVHLPMVLFMQTLLIPLDWSVYVKLLVVVASTTIASMASYLVFVRYTPLGWLLHGKRSFP